MIRLVAQKVNAQIREEAAEWLVEFADGNVGVERRQAFSLWLKASPENVRAYLQVTATFEMLGGIRQHCTENIETLIERSRAEGALTNMKRFPETAHEPASMGAHTSELWSRTRGFLAASAATLALGVAAFALWQNWEKGLYVTGIGEQRAVSLADGSTIELDAGSRLRVHFDPRERNVDLLEGQALFHVAKDPQRRFIVRSGTTHVEAVGTQFDVSREASGTVVTVLDGRVAVSASDRDAAPLFASAGEQVILTAQAASKPAHPDVSAATAWRERKLVFVSSPLTQVISEYNRYHEKRLVIGDPALSSFRISGVFSASDAESLIAFLRAQSNIEVRESDREILLKGK
jgi:transmembrane sensor